MCYFSTTYICLVIFLSFFFLIFAAEQARRSQRRDQTRRRLGQHPGGQHGRGAVHVPGLAYLAGRRPQHTGPRSSCARRHGRPGSWRVHRQPSHRTRRFPTGVRRHRAPVGAPQFSSNYFTFIAFFFRFPRPINKTTR